MDRQYKKSLPYISSPLSNRGALYIYKAGPRREALAVNDVGESIYATPALAGGRLYVRTKESLYCFARKI